MLLVYTTTPTLAEAKDLAQYIVEQGLAAGANIIPRMHSIYHWQGEIIHAEECICLFQSTKENFVAIEKSLKERHSYETPCIIAMPLEEVEKNFASWISQHCQPMP